MKLETFDDSSSSAGINDEDQVFDGQGYKLIDLKRFSSTLSEARVCEGEKYFRLMLMKPMSTLFKLLLDLFD